MNVVYSFQNETLVPDGLTIKVYLSDVDRNVIWASPSPRVVVSAPMEYAFSVPENPDARYLNVFLTDASYALPVTVYLDGKQVAYFASGWEQTRTVELPKPPVPVVEEAVPARMGMTPWFLAIGGGILFFLLRGRKK